MQDKEIIKALEEELSTALRINHRFMEACNTENPDDDKFIALLSNTIKFIHRLQAENEQLKAENERLKTLNSKLEAENYSFKVKERENPLEMALLIDEQAKQLKTAKAEAVKEFAERLKSQVNGDIGRIYMMGGKGGAVAPLCKFIDDIDNLVKEMGCE